MVDQFPPELKFWASRVVRGFCTGCRGRGRGMGGAWAASWRGGGAGAHAGAPTAVVVVSRSWGSRAEVSRGVPR